MIDAGDVERLRAAGVAERQVSAMADTIQRSSSQLVTRDYLDRRLAEEVQRTNASMLRWTRAFQVVVAAGLYLALRST